MTHEAPPPRLVDATNDADLRRDLVAVAAFDSGYDVHAGAARFESAIAELPPSSGGEGGGPTGDGVGSQVGTGATGAGATVAGKTGALAAVGLGIVVGAVIWAFAGDPSPARDQSTEPAPQAAADRDAHRDDPVPPQDVHEASGHAPADAAPSSEAAPRGATPSKARPSKATQPRARVDAPKVAPDDDALAREMAATHAAKRALASNPARALKLARAADVEFPEGPFAEDREGIEILALYALGDRKDADRRAGRFLAAHPHATYAARVQAARDHAGEKP